MFEEALINLVVRSSGILCVCSEDDHVENSVIAMEEAHTSRRNLIVSYLTGIRS